jgi:molybdate transport system permease protein
LPAQPSPAGGPPLRPARRLFRRLTTAAAVAFAQAIGLLLVVDLVFIVEYWLRASPENLEKFRAEVFSAETSRELVLSLASATFTTFLALLLAIPAGYALSRFRIPGKVLVDTLVDAAIVMPPLIMGVSLLVALSLVRRAAESLGTLAEPNPVLWGIFAGIIQHKAGIILAQFFVASALAIRAMKAAFDAADRRVEDVALTLGCTRFGAFWRAALPQARSGLLTGAVIAWSYTMGLFAPVAIVAGTVRGQGGTAILPTRAYLEVTNGQIEIALALTLLMAAIAMAVLMVLKLISRWTGSQSEITL